MTGFPPTTRLQWSPRPRVLVVEDDSDIRDVVLLALDAEGYEAQAAGDGRVALALLREWRPHLILLDLMMPEMDGWKFRARQLADPELADIPVVVLTAGRHLRARVDTLRATAIVPKPFNLDLLLAAVRSIAAIGHLP